MKKNIISFFLNFFQEKDSSKNAEKNVSIEKENTKIINKNGRLFFELPFLDQDTFEICNNNHFSVGFSSSEMLKNGDYRISHRRILNKRYYIVLIPNTEIKNPNERFTKRFIEIAKKDYGEESVNLVVGELAPDIAYFLNPKDLKENNIKTIVIPHEEISDWDQDCIFIIEQEENKKNILISSTSYGHRGKNNLWKKDNTYLSFVVSVEE